ncbi:hypothetical protein [Trinickia mobilis]|uniref:hypothetical protein n=1 Tax=Trinickia mobilis TaxID=2816356 RepID=UPI001A8FDF94|nr:hypothetical protein [Trinickia mobilis]
MHYFWLLVVFLVFSRVTVPVAHFFVGLLAQAFGYVAGQVLRVAVNHCRRVGFRRAALHGALLAVPFLLVG